MRSNVERLLEQSKYIMESEYTPNFEEPLYTWRLIACSSRMIPNGTWFNIQMSVQDLLDHLCEIHTLFHTISC